jgi:hypothetical protein
MTNQVSVFHNTYQLNVVLLETSIILIVKQLTKGYVMQYTTIHHEVHFICFFKTIGHRVLPI